MQIVHTKGSRINSLKFVVIAFTALALSACATTNRTNVPTVGPSTTSPTSNSSFQAPARNYNYTSDVYLNLVVPVFDPGLPTDSSGNLDYAKIQEKDIWPQVRRLEANRFAVDTKRALEQTNAFESINVTPDSSASADVYVLGEIKHSDTEVVTLMIRVLDATNRVWGEKEFSYRVHEGFYRDAFNQDKNAYEPVFNSIASYVYDLLNERSDEEKIAIQRVSELRYAAVYSPEAMETYLSQRSTRNGPRFAVDGYPADEDPMLQRIRAIRDEDRSFIDSLQGNYELYYADSNDSYLDYHRETLPVAAAIRRERESRANRQVAALFAGVGAVLLARNSGSAAGEIGSLVLAATSLYNLTGVIENNQNLRFQRQQLSEMGQNLDIQVTPQVIEFYNQQIELEGSAREQYIQLRAQLQSIYELEETPDTQL